MTDEADAKYSADATALAEVQRVGSETIIIEVDGTQFGIDLEQVTEVSHVPPITRLPFAPPAVPGVVSLRGAVLPVFDLGDRLFGRPSRRDGRLVIVADPAYSSRIALLVDRVVDMISEFTPVDDPPEELSLSLADGWIASIVAAIDGRLITMLNLPTILARSETADQEE